jgi:hypothetical protein
MVTTVRLPEGLRARADVVSQALGISINALIAVALADYINVRSNAPQEAVKPPGSPARSIGDLAPGLALSGAPKAVQVSDLLRQKRQAAAKKRKR